VGVRGGSEAIIHSLASLVEDIGDDHSYVMLKVDFSNAFNRVSRRDFLARLRETEFSGMCRWVEWCYSVFGYLWLGDSVIQSCEGVQQGDPLGPFLFSLSLSGLTTEIDKRCPSLKFNSWFLDDGTVVGKVSEVLRAFNTILELGPDLGLSLNPRKCELWWPSLDSDSLGGFPMAIPRLQGGGTRSGVGPEGDDGVELLGGPIGNAAFASQHMQKRLHCLDSTLNALRDIDDGQIELLLLRCCLGTPRMGYAIRSCAPEKIRDELLLFDDMVSSQLEAIVAAPLTSDARKLASLPIRLGGLGISEVSKVAAPAFISSVLATRSLQHRILGRSDLMVPGFEAAVAEYTLSHHINPGDFHDRLAAVVEQPITQRELCDVVHQATFQSIFETASLRNQALIRSNGGQHAGAFLHAVPNPVFNLCVESNSFRAILRRRLCLPVYANGRSSKICPECKTASLDVYGDHAEICPHSSDRVLRHNSIRDILGRYFISAGCPVQIEALGILPHSQQKPADLYCPMWSNGRPAAFDVTVTSPVQGSFIAGAARERGHAASLAEFRKDSKYLFACRNVGLSFVPVSVETCGTWGSRALLCFKSLIERLAHRSGRPRSQQARFFFQRLSVALQRCIGNALLRRAPLSGLDPGC
jgi:hypothetical protein